MLFRPRPLHSSHLSNFTTATPTPSGPALTCTWTSPDGCRKTSPCALRKIVPHPPWPSPRSCTGLWRNVRLGSNAWSLSARGDSTRYGAWWWPTSTAVFDAWRRRWHGKCNQSSRRWKKGGTSAPRDSRKSAKCSYVGSIVFSSSLSRRRTGCRHSLARPGHVLASYARLVMLLLNYCGREWEAGPEGRQWCCVL